MSAGSQTRCSFTLAAKPNRLKVARFMWRSCVWGISISVTSRSYVQPGSVLLGNLSHGPVEPCITFPPSISGHPSIGRGRAMKQNRVSLLNEKIAAAAITISHP